jgi:hypothetical protein
MELTRRFIFRANASAYGGQIFDRVDERLKKPLIVVTGATSSVTVAGGVSSNRSKPAKFVDGFIRLGDAGTDASAGYDDFKQLVRVSRGEVDIETLTTTTEIGAWVEDLMLGKGPKQLVGEQPAAGRGQPRVRVGRIAGAFLSRSGKPGDELSVKLVARRTSIDDVEIDGFPLKVTLNKSVFEQLDTFSKVQAAAADPVFSRDTNDCLFREARARSVSKGLPDVVRPATAILGTLVSEIQWGKKGKHPEATIDHHSVTIPNFGILYFGEMLISGESRRASMLRVKFGSPVKGEMALADYDHNGGWHPPTP